MLNSRIFSSLSTRSRTRKMELLRSSFDLGEGVKILDVGGQVDRAGQQLVDSHPYKRNLTVLNMRASYLDEIARNYPEVSVEQGDARKLPYPDKSFDLVYSNAVIEHVGDWQDQMAMAREVMRVGRNWFVTTPNRWYPFEFHMRLPLVSWLPYTWMQKVGSVWSYNHGEKRYRSGQNYRLRLLTQREMRKLFPGARVIPVRITAWPETLIATSAGM